MMLHVGDAAPDFVLKESDGSDVRLSSYLGRPVVLYFYPKDRTTGCTIQAKSVRDSYDEILAAGAVVLGISMDSLADHCDFRDRHGLPFKLLSDPEGRIHDLYEAWYTTILGKTRFAVKRCTYVIDQLGIIRVAHGFVNPVGHGRQIVEDLRRLAPRP